MAKEATKITKAGDAGPAAGSNDMSDAAASNEMARARIRVTAPAGPRRRAGLSFDKVARNVTLAELGETADEQEATIKLLLADPMLSVAPIVEDAGEN